MANSKYTAQEMRDKATELQESADEISREAVEEGGCTYKPLCKADAHEIETIANMLRQASEMRERAEEVRSRHSLYYGKIDYEHETAIVNEVDYILRGDAGKESK